MSNTVSQLLQVRIERGMYHYRQYLAQQFGDAMSTVIDGADQQLYGLPYFALLDKGVNVGYKYGVSCTAN